MKNRLLLFGAGGHGRVAADTALKMGIWKELAFLDDDANMKSSMGIKIIGRTRDFRGYLDDFEFFVALGGNRVREEIHLKVESAGAEIRVLMHPSSVIGEEASCGGGTLLAANSAVNCGSRLGKSCIVNTGATVDHDCVLEDFVHISPGAHTGGGVTIGKRTWVGMGATVINGIKIAADVIIGAGGVVVSDIEEAGTYAGVPARKIA